MDATPLPPELARELGDLRRRAYGPDADIAADPAGLRRLEELEALGHAAPTPLPATAHPRGRSAALDAGPARRHRRIVVVAVVAASVCAAVAGFALSTALPEGTTIVATAAERQSLVDRVDFARIGMIGARLQPFADFGELWVWSATNSAGSTCLLVGAGQDDALDVECATASAPVSLTLHVGDQVRSALVGGLPEGSEVRFTMDDGAVSVAVTTAES